MLKFLKSFKKGLSKTRESLVVKVRQAVGKATKIDDDLLEQIEEILIGGDVGVSASEEIIANLRQLSSREKLNGSEEIISLLKSEIVKIFENAPDSRPDTIIEKPEIWLIMGVNGTGKTTSIGKLAKYFRDQNKKVMIAACDTFRAAAVDQLAIWADRSGVEFVRAREGSDPAAVAYDAANSAKSGGIDILLVDTAGRLHTKKHLMDELKKIKRVLGKVVSAEAIKPKLVIDGTTGQNALSQARLFAEAAEGIDGLFLTKLDGTARGGVVIAIAREMSVPIDFIGLGEGIDDLKPFDPATFVEAIFE